MCATAANLVERVLPRTALRQWVLTFPFPWRRRLAHDGALLGALSRIFVETVHAFYAERAAVAGAIGAKSGAVTVVQRTSSDLRLNPHLHVVFLDGAYHEEGAALVWEQLGHLQTREVGEVLEHAVQRMARYLRRHGALEHDDDRDEVSAEDKLAASAVSGKAPPAGPQWTRGLAPLAPSGLTEGKPLCASLDGFTLHAATRAGAQDTAGREALLRYVLRPPIAQERLEARPDGLVRIARKRAYQDGTVAVDMDPLSLLCRLATSVPPPRFHTVKYAGVLASASTWRARVAPPPPVPPSDPPKESPRGHRPPHRPSATRRADNLRPDTANPRLQAARRPRVQPRRSVRTDLRPVVPRTHRDPRPAVRALFHLRASEQWRSFARLAADLQLDLLVEDLVVVECKATVAYNRLFEAQALTYLRLCDRRLALVINFGARYVRQGIHRVVNGRLEG
jgi:hypothetical protein